MMFHVMLQCAEDGWVVAECGCVSHGRDEKEAIHAWLWTEDQKAMKDYSEKQDFRPIVVAV